MNTASTLNTNERTARERVEALVDRVGIIDAAKLLGRAPNTVRRILRGDGVSPLVLDAISPKLERLEGSGRQ